MHVYRRPSGSGRHNTGARTRHNIVLFSVAANLFLLILVPSVLESVARMLRFTQQGPEGRGAEPGSWVGIDWGTGTT